MVHSHDDKFLMLFVFFLFFLNVLKRNRECVSEEGEAWSRVKKTSASVKKFKNYREWILGFRAKWKQTYRKEKKKAGKCPQVCPGLTWRYQSAKPCSHHCTSLSHSWITPSVRMSAPSEIKEKTQKRCTSVDMVTS